MEGRDGCLAFMLFRNVHICFLLLSVRLEGYNFCVWLFQRIYFSKIASLYIVRYFPEQDHTIVEQITRIASESRQSFEASIPGIVIPEILCNTYFTHTSTFLCTSKHPPFYGHSFIIHTYSSIIL